MVCVRYRPRQPRASPVWQVLHDHAAKVPGLSPEAAGAIAAFLHCGDLHAGFTRLHCPDCDHEYGFRGTRKPGFELPAAPQVAPADSGQGELFGDDYAQPDANDGEPVFWSASGGQDFPADDRPQPDLSACSAQADAPDCAE
jgi:hypothetical protein